MILSWFDFFSFVRKFSLKSVIIYLSRFLQFATVWTTWKLSQLDGVTGLNDTIQVWHIQCLCCWISFWELKDSVYWAWHIQPTFVPRFEQEIISLVAIHFVPLERADHKASFQLPVLSPPSISIISRYKNCQSSSWPITVQVVSTWYCANCRHDFQEVPVTTGHPHSYNAEEKLQLYRGPTHTHTHTQQRHQRSES